MRPLFKEFFEFLNFFDCRLTSLIYAQIIEDIGCAVESCPCFLHMLICGVTCVIQGHRQKTYSLLHLVAVVTPSVTLSIPKDSHRPPQILLFDAFSPN